MAIVVTLINSRTPGFVDNPTFDQTGAYRVDVDVRLDGPAPFTIRSERTLFLDDVSTTDLTLVIESESDLYLSDMRWQFLKETPPNLLFATSGYGCGRWIAHAEDVEFPKPPPEGTVMDMCLTVGRNITVAPLLAHSELVTVYGGLLDRGMASGSNPSGDRDLDRHILTGTFELRQTIQWWERTDTLQGVASGNPDGQVTAVVTFRVYPNSP